MSSHKRGVILPPKDKRNVCLTRAMKNVKHIQSIAPNTFPKGEAYHRIIPLETLMTLHTDAKGKIKNKELASTLEKTRIPSPTIKRGDAVGPGGTRVAGPLFTGTLYFMQVTFNNPSGLVGVSLGDADMQTAISYSDEAIEVISLYASAYGPNSLSVSTQAIRFTADITGNTYHDTDLQGWVDGIVAGNGLTNACIVVLNDISIATNLDANPQFGSGGYHSVTSSNNPYIFCNVFGHNLTVDDQANVYAGILSHEIAEATVDPVADGSNPEVCDACAPNCGNIWISLFDRYDRYIDALPAPFPGTGPFVPIFNYSFFINSVVRPDAYDPTSQCIYFSLDWRAPCAYPPEIPETPSA
jgi:hypothetical protein